ncbi:MAG: aldo/keto reductase [Hyphomicrobiales bacterium]|nr:aldo/keto reductase [Hyphomicrobiales bacterium]
MPALGFGTYRLRGETCARAVDAALRTGYRHIDTAAMYENEDAVGEGLRASAVRRDDVFVTTKVWTDSIGAGALERSAEASLKRLKLDRVDLLLIHWPNATIPLAESIAALNHALRLGYTRAIGVANFPSALLDEAVRLSEAPLAANQCEYHPLLDQSAVLTACRCHGVAFTSYCPLGRGDLTRDPSILAIAQRVGRAPSQVILRWHLQQPDVCAIPMSSNPAHIAQNFDVFDFSLTAQDMAALSALARPDGRMVNPGFAPRWDV